ncbi:porin [Vibrio cincinnatiensis]|uniref:porin n=1 Tax=Vibrio cincinnatiensis TaxID=675 RepID=UPI001EE14DAF|nr:porin [Vibrio cincinnatiensis]
MKYLHAAITLAFAANSQAAINYNHADTDTTLSLSGFLNGGYHLNKGDNVDWDNVSAQQKAQRNLDSILNSPSASEADKEIAREEFNKIKQNNPYWKEKDTSVDDSYLRLTIALNQKINDELQAFAIYERDFHTSDNDEDDVRDAYVGITSNYGSIRVGRDENSLTYVRDTLYTPEEKTGYERHSFFEPLTISGRNDNSIIYDFNNERFGIEAGYIIGQEEDYEKQSGYALSAKVNVSNFIFSAGYAYGKKELDKKGVYNQPDLTSYGYSPFSISEVFYGFTDNLNYKHEEKQFNLGIAYKADFFDAAFVYTKSKNDLDAKGENVDGYSGSNNLSYDLDGFQTYIAKQFGDKYRISLNYSYLENKNEKYNITDAVTVEGKYFFIRDSFIYLNVGLDKSDASDIYLINSGIRLSF